MQTKQDFFSAIEKNKALLNLLGVRQIGLFGSFVRGEATPKSDVDVLVEFEKGQKTFDNFMRLNLLLEEILQRDVELLTCESLSPYIGPHILKEIEYAALLS